MHLTHRSKLVVTTHTNPESPTMAASNAEISGCRDCLVNAIAHMMSENESFRKLINEAGRMANELRGKTQN
ncbi:MAG TPA: hypothetical protein PK339_12560 [Flavitalea sp.]|nr:hypothetical protein [Flavitalea sp.]